ncbi:hypothetical protein Pla52n_54730 [Stieleria varia]|uniref:Uncharacterized protein n=1 Tax=Stieleria varia TaxID=2528005 RepID=A0A5C6A419_9BACT|nr:hypothetical protein Pla52n_54730 [Stieleria varia]
MNDPSWKVSSSILEMYSMHQGFLGHFSLIATPQNARSQAHAWERTAMESLPRESQRGLEIVSRSAGRSLLIIGFPGRSLGTSGDDQREVSFLELFLLPGHLHQGTWGRSSRAVQANAREGAVWAIERLELAKRMPGHAIDLESRATMVGRHSKSQTNVTIRPRHLLRWMSCS